MRPAWSLTDSQQFRRLASACRARLEVQRREQTLRASQSPPPWRLQAVEGAEARESHPCRSVIPRCPHPVLAARQPGQGGQDAPPLGAVGLAFDPTAKHGGVAAGDPDLVPMLT